MSVWRFLSVYVCTPVRVYVLLRCIFDGLSHVGPQTRVSLALFFAIRGGVRSPVRVFSVTLHCSILAVLPSPSSWRNGLSAQRSGQLSIMLSSELRWDGRTGPVSITGTGFLIFPVHKRFSGGQSFASPSLGYRCLSPTCLTQDSYAFYGPTITVPIQVTFLRIEVVSWFLCPLLTRTHVHRVQTLPCERVFSSAKDTEIRGPSCPRRALSIQHHVNSTSCQLERV